MDAESLRALQAPLEQRYREDPAAARIGLRARGRLDEGIACSVETARGLARAGLHPATGGDGTLPCSGDMLLEALAACAGVTLKAVATALGIGLRDAEVLVEGDLDFRGTPGVDRDAPVGFTAIRLTFRIDSDADDAQLDRLLRLTERCCVVCRTLCEPPPVTVRLERRDGVAGEGGEAAKPR